MKLLCDVEIRADSARLRAHRLVLSACANYFYDHFCLHHAPTCPDVEVIHFPDTSGEIMTNLIDSMYTGRLWVNQLNAADLLHEARNIGYYNGVLACEQYLETVVNASNCYSYLQFAHENELAELQEVCLRCIAGNFDHLAQGPDYLALTLEMLQTLLERDDIHSEGGELSVFYRMLNWINHDQARRCARSFEQKLLTLTFTMQFTSRQPTVCQTCFKSTLVLQPTHSKLWVPG